MTRSRLVSGVLGLILLACAAVIVLDQGGKFGSGPLPGTAGNSASGSGNAYDLPTTPPPAQDGAATPLDTPASTPADPAQPTDSGQGTESSQGTEIAPAPQPATPAPTDSSGYGELK